MQHMLRRGCIFCLLCGEEKENQTALMEHLSLKHRIRCGQCGARFKDQEQLDVPNTKSNQSKLTKYKKSLIFQCANCSVVFFRKVSLERHQLNCQPAVGNDVDNEISAVKEEVNSFDEDEDLADNLESRLNSDGGDNDSFVNINTSSLKNQNEDNNRFVNIEYVYKVDGEEEVFSCRYCVFSCTNKHKMLIHIEVEHDEEPKSDAFETNVTKNGLSDQFTCRLCGKEFSKLVGLNRHMSKKHSEEEYLEEEYVKEENLYSKPDVQKRIIEKPLSCNFCHKHYSRSDNLKRHMSTMHGVNRSSLMVRNSVEHMALEVINEAIEVINGTIYYKCEVCEKHLTSKKGFVRHMRIHTGERPFTCHVCGKSFRSYGDMSQHIRFVHEKIKNFPCDICGRCFKNKTTRTDHRRKHTKERPFICQVCGKSFPTHNSIYVHRRVHTSDFPYKCLTCGRSFLRQQQLDNHAKSHTGERPYPCNICERRFKLKNDVVRHRLTHRDERPFVCSICGDCFAQKRYLSCHYKTHHPEEMLSLGDMQHLGDEQNPGDEQIQEDL